MLFVPAATVMAPALLAYGGAGRFGHHLIIPLCAAMAFAHAVRAASSRGGCANSAIYAGLWCGIVTAVSVEMLPFALLTFAGLALAWVLDGDEAAAGRVEGCAVGFTVIAAAAWLLDPPNGGLLAIEVDRLSLPYVLLGPALLAAAKALARFSLPGAGGRLAAVLGVGLLTLVLWLAAFPELARGIAPGTPAEVQRLIWDNNPELQPIGTARRLIGWGGGGILLLALFLAGTLKRPPRPAKVLASLLRHLLRRDAPRNKPHSYPPRPVRFGGRRRRARHTGIAPQEPGRIAACSCLRNDPCRGSVLRRRDRGGRRANIFLLRHAGRKVARG